MTSAFLRSTLAAAALTFLAASPSLAAMVNLKAELNGAAEVPPNPTTATGTFTATYDTDSKKLVWKGSYTGLSGPATAAHLHAGEPGKNGGVSVPLFAGPAAKTPFEGEATLTDAQAADLLAGRLYANIHTDGSKAGEIRGQVTK
ncbi:MAG: CHRD domain-containing protein [Pseudolabrys sp.]|nr:CHRD domain-containing protein [Pseudolabrys sp.]